ncbi:hypothetical protein AK812_SmicGene20747 [Symbiodinium microadriaticum]|uniref:Uncharacterized protein n=1 Tax=Symbiodinium microadriaticum TaxID=2951 RepID=A0A1Q9DPC6_SYMMI|nr:hypothetical protein AK812_SmicGene20747 [Symbiodinium microadriaticum]
MREPGCSEAAPLTEFSTPERRFNKMHAHSKADAAACAKIRREQLSRARQMLAAAVLADRNVATLEALTDPARL